MAASTGANRRGGPRWLLASAAAPVLVFWQAVLGRRLIAPGDGHTFYLPLRTVVGQTWRAGSFPGWDRGTFGGSPLFSLHQAAALHPSMLLHVFLDPVLAQNLTLVTALMTAAVGAHLLAHRLTGDHLSSAVAGCAFSLCGFQFAHLAHVAIITTTAWLPWALWAADRLVEQRSVRRFAAAAVVVALAVLSGHGQMLAYLLAAMAVYGLVLAGRRRLVRVVPVVGAMVAGLALAAVQLVPVLVGLSESNRSRLSQAEATAFSQDPRGLLLHLSPFLYGNSLADGPVSSPYAGRWTLTELGGYVGMAALVLAVASVPGWRGDRRVLALVVIAVGSTLVALGGSTPIGAVVHALPGFGQMRSWARYTVGLQLSVAVLAALGTARLRARQAIVRPAFLAGGVVSLGLMLAVAPGLGAIRVGGGELLWAVGAPAVAGLVAVGLAVAMRRHPSLAVGLVLLVAADPTVNFGWWFRWRTGSPSPAEARSLLAGHATPPWGPVPDRPGGIDRYLWAGDALEVLPFGPRMAAASGALSVTGTDPLAPADYLEATGTDYLGNVDAPSRLLGGRSHLLDLLRVTVVSRYDGRVVRRLERRPSLPEAFLVGRTRRASHRAAVAAATGYAPLDPSREAFVEVRCGECPKADPGRAGRVGRAGAVDWGRSSARLHVVADRRALLVLSQAWSPGWSATVDGRAAPVMRVDGLVQGVAVPRGASTVVLRYRPPGLMLGSAISLVTIMALLVALVANAVEAPQRSEDLP